METIIVLRVPVAYYPYMAGRDTQFAKASSLMGVDLGYKGYKGTLLYFDIVLDLSKGRRKVVEPELEKPFLSYL